MKRSIIKGFLGTIFVVVALFVALLVTLSVTEYKPKAVEKLKVKQAREAKTVAPGDKITILTWNIGYGTLDESADFFLDGGKKVKTADKEQTKTNMDGIVSRIKEIKPDLCFFQEADVESHRSNYVNEQAWLARGLGDVSHSFATNYKALYIPYPFPPIGPVQAGIMTTSTFSFKEAVRYALPCPYSWPESLGNLKRCIMVNRIPVEGTNKELVAVNLHLEAYDSGEGKVKQTQMLRELLQTEAKAGNYVIAGGDFNQTFSNVDVSAYPQKKGLWAPGRIESDSFSEGLSLYMDGKTPSCRSLDQPYKGADPATFQYYVIDGFIVSSNIKVKAVKTKDFGFKYTDHNPVVLKAVLKK
ncbi:Endonuclease/Exonuclease/phosphatase family protein [Lachnospiraceae bacterium KHCPX20]|nr:Endonuclease/Exonuclease/phosphatase family protein [Lachnospiraceae bacterium KHCPX20]